MDIVERLRTNWDFDNNDKLEAADEIERLRGQIVFERLSLRSALDKLRKLDGDIERLRGALKTFADNVRETNAGIDKNWAETVNPLKAEIERLRQQNAKLLAALKDMNGAGYAIVSIYRDAIAKATGGE